jgi:serine/threonine protein kinase
VLPQSGGYTSYEMDFVIIADRWVFMLDEKSWRGEIRGNDQFWYRNGAGAEPSPLGKADRVAKVLAGWLRNAVREMGDERFVRGGALLSLADHLPLLSNEPRAQTGIFLLKDVLKRLVRLDQDGGTLRVQDNRQHLANALLGLSAIPAMPKKIGDYTIKELLFTRPSTRAYAATLNWGTPKPYTLMAYDLGAQAADQQAAAGFYQREYVALEQLAGSGVAPQVKPPFPWSDFTVIPIEPLPGKSLAEMASPAAQDDLAEELRIAAAAFTALDTVHKAGVIHRALGPDTVYVQRSAEKSDRIKVGFNNFYAARASEQSIAVTLNELAIEDPYAAPELALGYEFATKESDTYSLALIFLERLTGQSIGDLRAPGVDGALGLIAVPPFAARWTALNDGDANDLNDVFGGIIGASSPEKRWPAKEAAELLSGLGKSLRAEQASVEPVVLDGRYEIRGTLGRGSFAITYLARDLKAGEPDQEQSVDLVAVKQFRHATALEQIQQEWKTLKQLKSDQFPSIYGFDPDREAHVILEYIPGDTLEQLKPELPWDLERWRAFAFDLLDALKYLEDRNLLHRDIKPANIILRSDNGRPVLIDCGLSQRGDVAGRPAGSPRYMPPEAASAEQPPSSTDRYALAVVLYLTLTGTYPDQTSDGDALVTLQSMGRTSEDLAVVQRILTVLRAAMSKEPAQRPTSAAAFARDLIERMQTASVVEAERAPDLAELANPWVDDIRSLYRNSVIGNANNRGLDTDFVRETYVPTALDDVLLPSIVRDRPKAVFLSGNPGDGKTAFLGQVRQYLDGQGATCKMDDPSGWEFTLSGHIYRCCYDASEANGSASADEQLVAKLAGLEGSTAPEASLTVLIAINDGRLADFFDRERLRFTWLATRIRVIQRAPQKIEEQVWLVDLKRRAFVQDGAPHGDKPSVAMKVLNSLISAEHWRVCEGCAARTACPIMANAAALRKPTTALRLEHLLLLTHLRQQRHITMRDLRSAFAYLLTSDTSCAEIHAQRKNGSIARALDYWRATFRAPVGQDDLTYDLAQLDPAQETHPNLDRFLYYHRQSEDMDQRRALFAEGTDLAPQMYANEREWIADVKRRLYFEGADEALAPLGIATKANLLAYRYAAYFFEAPHNLTSTVKLKQRIARGILRSDGINVEPGDNHLGLKVSASETEGIIILKEFDLGEFKVEIEAPAAGERVERIPETLRFKRRNDVASGPALQLTLDHFELLMRLADGLQPDAPELRPLLEDLIPFKNALLLEGTTDLTVIEDNGHVHHITQKNGKIVLEGVQA